MKKEEQQKGDYGRSSSMRAYTTTVATLLLHCSRLAALIAAAVEGVVELWVPLVCLDPA